MKDRARSLFVLVRWGILTGACVRLFTVTPQAYADVLTLYSFGGCNATITDANIIASDVTGNTPHVTGAAGPDPTCNTFDQNNGMTHPSAPFYYLRMGDGTATTAAGSFAAGSYFYFTVTANPGYTFTPTSITFNGARALPEGTRGFALFTSVGGFTDFANNLLNADFTAVRPDWPAVPISVELTGVGYSNLTTMTVRIYVYTPDTTKGVDIDDITVNGTSQSAQPTQTLSIIKNNNDAVLTCTGIPGNTYVVQVTTNLASPVNWVALSTNQPDVNGQWIYTDVGAIANFSPARYYRTVRP